MISAGSRGNQGLGDVVGSIAEDDLPRRCRRGRRCARRGEDGQAAILALPGLCDRDHQLLVAALRELPDSHTQLGDLELLEPARSGMGGSQRGHAKTPPLPLQLAPLTLADDIHDELIRWEDIVRDRTGMDAVEGRPRSRLLPNRRVPSRPAAVRRAADLLRNQVTTLLALVPTDMIRWSTDTTRAGERLVLVREDGYAGAIALIELHTTARRLIGDTVEECHLKGRDCPGCGYQTLRLISAKSHVRCSTCGHEYAEHEYDFLARVLTTQLEQTPARAS